MLYRIKDKDNNVHIILIVAEYVKVSINGVTRFVHYTGKDGLKGVVFGSDLYDLVNFNNDNIDMHVGIDCTTAESFIINSDLFNSLEKKAIRFGSICNPEVIEDLSKNIPQLYLKDGSESKELLDSIDRFLVKVHECINCATTEVYYDESQSKIAHGWLHLKGLEYIYARIIDKADELYLIDWTTHGNVIVRTTGYAIGLTETGLIKIKCTSNIEGYIYAR